MTADADLLAAVLADPADDHARGVYADWLDDRGEHDRAEFVRVQCKLAEWVDLNAACVCRAAEDKFHCRRCLAWDETESIRHVERRLFCDHRPYDELRQHGLLLPRSWAMPGHYTGTDGLMVLDRGFVAEVRLTLAAFLGGRCGRCDGGRRMAPPPAGLTGGTIPCTFCDTADGVIPGLAADLFGRHPVTAVTLVDREPHRSPTLAGESDWFWRRWTSTEPGGGHDLPPAVFDLLPPPGKDGLRYPAPAFPYLANYPTRELALSALRDAAAPNYGRSLAGLPPLPAR